MTRLGWNCLRCHSTYVAPDLVCETCGTLAGQLHWILSLVERMGNASTFYGRRPGRCPDATDRQAAASASCPDCDGSGGERPVLLSAWVCCRRCAGTGYLWRDQLTPGERAADDVVTARLAAESRRREARQGNVSDDLLPEHLRKEES